MSKINLKYYNNQENNCYHVLNNIDNELVTLLKNPENDEKIKEKNPRLYYYLLDHHNENLVKWIDIKPDSNVLEVNSGLGATTKVLCEKCNSVTTVNFSKINAEITEQRLKNFDNFEIIVGNIKEIEFSKKFDYIVLTDVMEFCRAFFHEIDFIKYFKSLLKEDGAIILTVENRYGIQNFSGAENSITIKPFDRINNFKDVPFLKSFSKPELENIFKKAGFENIDFYYPIPNHHMNREIISDEYISNSLFGRKIATKYSHYMINKNNAIDETNMIQDVAEMGMFPFFANSYIIVASDTKKQLPYYSQYKDGILTTLHNYNGQKYCRKTILYKEAQSTIDNMYNFYIAETKRIEEQKIQNIKYAKCEKQGDSIILDFAKGTPLNKIALEYIHNKNKLLAILVEYKELIYKLYPNIRYQDIKVENMTLENVACTKNANIDLNMANIFKDGDNYTIIDYDKSAEIIPLNYILAQGLFVFTVDSGFEFDEEEYLKLLGISEREFQIYRVLYAQNLKM